MNHPKMVGCVGVEPTTPALSRRCSTTELTAQIVRGQCGVQSCSNPALSQGQSGGKTYHVKDVEQTIDQSHSRAQAVDVARDESATCTPRGVSAGSVNQEVCNEAALHL